MKLTSKRSRKAQDFDNDFEDYDDDMDNENLTVSKKKKKKKLYSDFDKYCYWVEFVFMILVN